MNLDIKIMAVHQREQMANDICNRLSLDKSNIIYDERPHGGSVKDAARFVWRQPIKNDESHRLVLQDDVWPCNNFIANCKQIIANYPDAIIGLFPNADLSLTPSLREKTARFIKSKTSPYWHVRFITGAGIIMPSKYIDDCWSWIDSNRPDEVDDDRAITDYAKAHKIELLTTIPVLIQHIGDISVVNANRSVRRTQFFEDDPSPNWDDRTINKIELLKLK